MKTKPRNEYWNMAENKFWNVAVSDDGASADLEITGIIVQEDSELKDWWTDEEKVGVSLQSFKEDLKALEGVSVINMTIDSPGGSYFAGIQIFNLLNEIDATIKAKIIGNACSSAATIMCAADEISIFDTSYVMIHPVHTNLAGQFNAYGLQEKVNQLRQFDQNIAEIYANRTGKSVDEVLDLMKTEPYISGADAVEMGLCDKLISTKNEKKKKGACNFMPNEILNAAKKPIEEVADTTEIQAPEKDAEKKETPKGSGPDYVDFAVQVREFENKARQADNEVTRIKNLIDFGNRAGLSLEQINDAIVNNKSAETIAMEILISQRGQGGSIVENMEKDTAESGVQNIAGSPGADAGKLKDDLTETIWKSTNEALKNGGLN